MTTQDTAGPSLTGDEAIKSVAEGDKSVTGVSRIHKVTTSSLVSNKESEHACSTMDRIGEASVREKESDITLSVTHKSVLLPTEITHPDDDDSSANEFEDLAVLVKDPQTKSSPHAASLPEKNSKVKMLSAMKASVGPLSWGTSIE